MTWEKVQKRDRRSAGVSVRVSSKMFRFTKDAVGHFDLTQYDSLTIYHDGESYAIGFFADDRGEWKVSKLKSGALQIGCAALGDQKFSTEPEILDDPDLGDLVLGVRNPNGESFSVRVPDEAAISLAD